MASSSSGGCSSMMILMSKLSSVVGVALHSTQVLMMAGASGTTLKLGMCQELQIAVASYRIWEAIAIATVTA
jgi:hypothetical protein